MGSEFELIRKYFTHPGQHTVLGVGDDAALMRLSPGRILAASSDMLVAGRHFFPDTDPCRLGHKALAVNLSDLAAMGALPRWVLLSLALPRADEAWVAAFAAGFADEARTYGVDWVGGDTTGGPLNLSVTILGEVDAQRALKRSGAVPGDTVWLSGTVGDAALGLAALLGRYPLPEAARQGCVGRLERPTPRVALGQALAGLAHSAIDISDGLLADLGHLVRASGVGAELEYSALPLAPLLAERASEALVREAILAGGDDYELCFTAAMADTEAVLAAARLTATPVAAIGVITAGAGVRVRDSSGVFLSTRRTGFDHFSSQGQQ